jgi:hypothetical protein
LKRLADGDRSSAETAKPVAAAEQDLEAEDARSSSAASALGVLLTYPQRRAVAEIFPESTGRLKLDEQKTLSIPFTTDEMETIRKRAKAAIPHAENGMKGNSLRHLVRAVTRILEKSKGIRAIPAHERVYQFKITLLTFEPPIWRRIQVKDCTLDKLHAHIQTAMGWTNSHLHQFVIDGEIHGDPELLCDGWQDENTPVDSLHTRIGTIVPEDGKQYRFLYEYDFGDDWQHEVLFEGCLRASKEERYPLCVEGERACPPEDVGGVRGYAEFLEALADPDHEQHDEYGEWAGPFHAERFDAEKATKAMRRGLPNWRRYR